MVRAIYDCFASRNGVDYLCEVYTSDSGYVEEFAVFELLQNGCKGNAIAETAANEFRDEIQEKYYNFVTEGIDANDTEGGA